tara:strand:+ start:3118 stop:4083 length:966 start_codon:yes stop_codon:yes gene_type:complete
MSSLNVHDIKGLATFSNTVRVPSGHNFETYGEMVANGTLTVPRWTTNTRPSNPDVGSIGFNTDESVAEIYTGNENGWVAVGQTKNDGTSQDKAVERSTEILEANPSAPTGWYWMIINNQAKQVWVDNDYDGGGWVMVGSHPYGVNLQSLNYNQAAESYDWYATSTWGSGDPKSYSVWAGLRAWDAVAAANNVGRTVVLYVASSQVPLGSTGSHTKRARWNWTGWGTQFDWVGESGLNTELGSPDPGMWTYHIANGYNFTTTDRDQDQYGSNCSNLYNRAPWWYGACWSGSFWGGNGANYQPATFWTSSGSDWHNYGGLYVK